METKWSVYAKRADFNAIAEKYHIDPVVARVIRNRDIIEDADIYQYLNGTMSDLHSPRLMADMDKGTYLMQKAIACGQKIRVIADYDVDGVMSGFVLTDGLRRLGANVSCKIPHRVKDGYGMNARLIEEAHEDGVQTIITCDNGISAFDAVALAKSYDMTVVVTDHHMIPYETAEDGTHTYHLVPADAVVDIHREDCNYPFKGLCGTAVAYKFLQALYERMEKTFDADEMYVPFVALATVCDIMDLTDENRIFVRHGLATIKQTNNIGMRALLRATELVDKEISAYHFGFILGPCINAMGRLGDANDSLALFFSEDSAEAYRMACRMVEQNTIRKAMTEEGTAQAIALVEERYDDDKILVVYMPRLHESLAGIVAGKLKEKYYRPAIVLTDAGEDTEEEGADTHLSEEKIAHVKGSGRSIEGYHLYDALQECSELLTKFGGHALAAGVSLRKQDVDALRSQLNAKLHADADVFTPVVQLDVAMPMSYISTKLIRDLERLEPFGKANEKPTFGQARLRIKSAEQFGSDGQYIRLQFMDEQGFTTEGVDFHAKEFLCNIKMWFNDEECDRMLKGLPNNVCLDVAYYPAINSYRGRNTLQVKPICYRKSQV